MKTCRTCNVTKPLEEFSWNNKEKGYRQSKCKSCVHEYNDAYRQRDPDRLRVKWKKASAKYYAPDKRRNKTLRAYGLTEETYNEMFDSQGGKCLICGDALTLVVDHDHVTGKVRGLLCNQCNVGLGSFKDRLDLLRNAVLYLQKSVSG